MAHVPRRRKCPVGGLAPVSPSCRHFVVYISYIYIRPSATYNKELLSVSKGYLQVDRYKEMDYLRISQFFAEMVCDNLILIAVVSSL